MSTSVRTSHTRIPSVRSTSTNNYHSSTSATTSTSSSAFPASVTSPDPSSHISPARKTSFTISFGNMGLTNGGVGASPGSSSSPSSVHSNKVNGLVVTPTSTGPSGSAGNDQSSSTSGVGNGFRLRSLLPFGPNKNPTPISPTVSPSGPPNGSFGGFGARRSITLQRDGKLNGSGATSSSGPRDRQGSLGQNGTSSKTVSHFGFKGTVGKGKGKGKAKDVLKVNEEIPVISIDKQTSQNGKDEVNEFGVYGGSRSMDFRRSSSDTIASGNGRNYATVSSRSRSIDWEPGGRVVSATSVPETVSSLSLNSRIQRLKEGTEAERNGDHESQPNTPYTHSISSASTIPAYMANQPDNSSDSPDPILLRQDPTYIPSGILPTGSSHDHPIDLSTIIEADSSGISKHLPSATSSEASISPTNSRAQSEEPQPFPITEHQESKSILSGLNDFLQPPIHSPIRTASLQVPKSPVSASTVSLITSSAGVDADASASASAVSRSPSHSPQLRLTPMIPSPTFHSPHSPFVPPEDSSLHLPDLAFTPHSSPSIVPSPFEPNLNSSFALRQGSVSPDYIDDSGLELSTTEVDKQVRDAIRSSIGNTKNRKSGGSAGGLSGPRGWLEDTEVMVVDGNEEDGVLDGREDESRVEENEVVQILHLDSASFFSGTGQDDVGTRADKGISMSINFDALDPDLRELLSPNRLKPSPKRPLPATTSTPMATPVPESSTSTSASISNPTFAPILLPSESAPTAGVASTSVLSSPWSSGNGSATIVAPTPTIARTTDITSIRTRKNALGVDLNASISSKVGLKTPSPTPSDTPIPVATTQAAAISSSRPNSLLPKPPPLPLPPQVETSRNEGTGIVAAAKSALLGRRPAGQSSLPRLKPVVKQGQGQLGLSSPSTTVANPAGNAGNANTITTEARMETPPTNERAIYSSITSPSTTTIPSTTISSISSSSSACPPPSISVQQSERALLPVEVTPASPSIIERNPSSSSSSSLSTIPPAMRGVVATAPPSPLSGAFALATSTPVVDRVDRRAFFELDEGEIGSGRGRSIGMSGTATLGRVSGAGSKAKMVLSGRPSSPSLMSPSALPPSTVSPQAQKLAAGLELSKPSSSSASTLSGRRIASGDYPKTVDRLDSTGLSPNRAYFPQRHQEQASPEVQDASASFWKGRHRRRSMSVGTDPRGMMLAGANTHSASANATRGFLAAARRAREYGGAASAMSNVDGGRPGTSMSGFSVVNSLQREPDGPRKAPMMEWLGPRTAKAFRAAGLLDFDAPFGSSSPSEFGEQIGTSKHGRYGSLRSPSRMTHSEAGGPSTFGRSTTRRPSVGISGGYFGLAPLGGSPSPTSVMESPTFAYRERDRETPTRSASTAPTSVSGASWVREREGERVERVERERERVDKERERNYEELAALKDKHAVETSALLGALADSQRSARVLREEVGELRERITDLERNNEKLEGISESLKLQNEELKEDLQRVKEETEDRLEEEFERAARVEEENIRLREECARLVDAEAEVERLKRILGGSISLGRRQPYTGSPLRYSSRAGSPSFDFDSGEVEGFGAHEVEMSTESDAIIQDASSRLSQAKEISTHTKSIHSPFLPPLSSSSPSIAPRSSLHSSSPPSEDNSDTSRSRRISMSSIFPVPPPNMSMLMHEDSIHSADDGSDRPLPDNSSYHFSGSDYSEFSRKGSPPPSPTIAIPLRQQETSTSSQQYRHRYSNSIASSQSPTTPSFSMMSGSPESLFLRPEHEMHLRDLDSVSLDFQLDDQDNGQDDEIQEIPR